MEEKNSLDVLIRKDLAGLQDVIQQHGLYSQNRRFTFSDEVKAYLEGIREHYATPVELNSWSAALQLYLSRSLEQHRK